MITDGGLILSIKGVLVSPEGETLKVKVIFFLLLEEAVDLSGEAFEILVTCNLTDL